MKDDIDVHFDSRFGVLVLTCGIDAFGELRDKVLAESKVLAGIEGHADTLQRIVIEVWPDRRPAPTPREIMNQVLFLLMGFALIVLVCAGFMKLREMFC